MISELIITTESNSRKVYIGYNKLKFVDIVCKFADSFNNKICAPSDAKLKHNLNTAKRKGMLIEGGAVTDVQLTNNE